MNIKQLNAFREVMLSGSVSAAARNLHRTQPAISALITNLETEIGFKLFDRRNGRLHPVPEAQFLLSEATEILNRLNTTKRTMKNIRELERGVIKVVSMPGPSVFLLPELIANFVQNRDEVSVSLFTRSSFQAQQLVSAQQYDIGLADVSVHETMDTSLINHDILNFKCLCVLNRNDPLCKQDRITPADLDGKPMATLYSEHPTYVQTKAAFDDANADFNVRFQTQYFIPLFTYIERGLAYAIVDPLSAESYRTYRGDGGTIVYRPFAPTIELVASIMTPAHRPASNLAKAFNASLRDEMQRIQDAYDFGGL